MPQNNFTQYAQLREPSFTNPYSSLAMEATNKAFDTLQGVLSIPDQVRARNDAQNQKLLDFGLNSSKVDIDRQRVNEIARHNLEQEQLKRDANNKLSPSEQLFNLKKTKDANKKAEAEDLLVKSQSIISIPNKTARNQALNKLLNSGDAYSIRVGEYTKKRIAEGAGAYNNNNSSTLDFISNGDTANIINDKKEHIKAASNYAKAKNVFSTKTEQDKFQLGVLGEKGITAGSILKGAGEVNNNSNVPKKFIKDALDKVNGRRGLFAGKLSLRTKEDAKEFLLSLTSPEVERLINWRKYNK